MEIENTLAAKRKTDKELEATAVRVEEMQAENQKMLRSKKKVQEEVSERKGRGGERQKQTRDAPLLVSVPAL